VKVHYPSVHEMTRLFAPAFRLVGIKGIGITVPPSYLEKLARRFPKVLRILARVDTLVSNLPVLRGLADHILFEFRRVGSFP